MIVVNRNLNYLIIDGFKIDGVYYKLSVSKWVGFNNPRNPNINLQRVIIQKSVQLIDDDGLIPQERLFILDERDFNNMRRREWEDGLQQGQLTEKQNIARNLLAEGVELTLIAKTTSLSIAEIEALASS